MFFTFREDAHWNDVRHAVNFGVEIGEYREAVRVPQRVFQCPLPVAYPQSGTPKPTESRVLIEPVVRGPESL